MAARVTTPRLPFRPEPLNRLRERYNSAIAQVFDCRERIPDPVPSQLRGHVFDCEDGIRLIISRDSMEDGVYLHLSVSIEPGTTIWSRFAGKGLGAKKRFKRLALSRFAEVSGDRGSFMFAGFTDGKGVPHWFRFERPQVPHMVATTCAGCGAKGSVPGPDGMIHKTIICDNCKSKE